ncbi:MAG TPA: GNAT family N-acetyltransferase [Thermoanaerobaculia bacterium]|nr:GNAT family N-acetyltransferase [Thermoanaerobaculia bacterium]
MSYTLEQEGFTVSTDPARLDVDAIHAALAQAYWSEGIPREIVERSLRGSLCFGLYAREEGAERQIGFARVITDAATFSYLCDVYVLSEFRGRGSGKFLMRAVLEHPDLQGLRRFNLVTRDAHELYRRFGFAEIQNPDRHMEIVRPGLYLQKK